MGNFTVIVLDFETTGLSPQHGDRAIEIGAVRIDNNTITDSYQSLMNPGQRISYFIESYTGITNEMLEKARPCGQVMGEFTDFISDYPLVAHNASFDRRFLEFELDLIDRGKEYNMACSMLAARRLFQDAPDHKLGTLVDYCDIETDGTFHRALADAEMTARLWIQMVERLKDDFAIKEVSFELMQQITRISKVNVSSFLCQIAQ
jgi:DNA polymerase-3 subunit epsilon